MFPWNIPRLVISWIVLVGLALLVVTAMPGQQPGLALVLGWLAGTGALVISFRRD